MPGQHHKNIFLRMHPVHRIAISLVIAGLAFSVVYSLELDGLTKLMAVWNGFGLSFILTSWIVFFTRSHTDIRKLAQQEDGSRWFVIGFVLLSALASMGNVFLLLISEKGNQDYLSIILAFTGMLFSWIMVHTLFTFHYAHLYYDENVEGGLEFPKETNPDYLDFAYFSFVVGMTFQVSDVEISSRQIRRWTLLHSLLAFGLNTFVVALTVNMIAGL